MAFRDEWQRLEAIKLAVHRKAGAFGRLNDEQREWLAAWRKQQPPFDYVAFINGEDDDSLRSDIRLVLHGNSPQILVTDTDAQVSEKWQRYLERR